jgi:hypothetical protein
LYLQVPDIDAITNQGNQKLFAINKEPAAESNVRINTSANKTKNDEDMHRRMNSKNRRRQPRSLADNSDLSETVKEGKNGLEYKTIYLEDWVLGDYLIPELFLQSTLRWGFFSAFEFINKLLSRDKPHERYLSSIHNTQTSLNALESSPDSESEISKSKSLAVGTTGMYIKLIDVTPIPSILSNGTSTFPSVPMQQKRHVINPDLMQAIGESSLPVSFKNLQTGIKASPTVFPIRPSTGSKTDEPIDNGSRTEGISQSCQFVVNMNVPPIDKNQNKDLNKLFLSQLVANITNSGIDMTADKYLDMKNKSPVFATTVIWLL